MTIYRHREWNDETCISTEIPIWLGATLESSLFGAETIYAEDASPWLDRNLILRAEEDLDGLECPNFFRSGLMPLAHRYYEVLNELLEKDFKVTFPEWGRGPFGVAFHLRGFENLLMDMASNAEFAHKLMRVITDSRKKWTEDRAKFLGCSVEKGNLYNDEVNTPALSPKLYEDFVLPYEQELSQFHGGILYWHSCGDTTELVHLIARIQNLEMFHVGPWTSGTRCVEVFENKVPLEFCLHPLRDVQDTQVEGMKAKLAEIAKAVKAGPYTVRADGLQVFRGLDRDLPQIKEWIKVADEFLSSH
jgi:uroporphyrinogen-III decarboxylase